MLFRHVSSSAPDLGSRMPARARLWVVCRGKIPSITVWASFAFPGDHGYHLHSERVELRLWPMSGV
jgi:hypothetical protein